MPRPCACCGSTDTFIAEDTFGLIECPKCGSTMNALARQGVHEHPNHSDPDRVRVGRCLDDAND